jgi:thymidine phosphorylase
VGAAAPRAPRLAGGRGSRPETGLVFRVKPGERVQIGDVLCEIHASSFENLDWAADALENAFVISDVKYEPPPRVIQVIRSDEVANHPCS